MSNYKLNKKHMTPNQMESIEHRFSEKMHENNRTGDLTRARAVSVGIAFGGVVEVSMRLTDGKAAWAILQPVEVVELVHQLAASIGCHIHIQPRKDFSSWRNWNYSQEELDHYGRHAPAPNDMALFVQKGAELPPPELQPGLKIERKNHEPVATKKTVNRRSTKRVAATT